MRVCIDSNIIISSILFPQGKVATVFSYIIENHDVIIASYSITECKVVFERKFPTKNDQLKKFFSSLSFELFETPKKINRQKFPYIRDIKDVPILVSAILSDSDILLTGDKDFEGIKIKRPLIFTPHQYFEFIQEKDK